MNSNEIREIYLSFFEQQGHRRLSSASLVPATFDESVLLTTAGMHPLKPYFLGQEQPPASRLTSCQKCFRTTDIENVGNTARHLTMFEMLGNFSIGDYFKADAIKFAWKLSTEGFGFNPDDIWVTVFEGDEGLGLGPDQEAIDHWLELGVPKERIVLCSRKDNFWQAGPTGPCGPCSELYLDRGLSFGKEDDLPAGENERFLEFWNLVFMEYNQSAEGVLTPLPAKSIDTGLGLNRLAAIKQNVESVFETDQFVPLIKLGEQLSGKRYGENQQVDRALRILADHSRAMTFLLADGVVPSNEDRGYILRRVMRRAIQQGRTIGIEQRFLGEFAATVTELMGEFYPEIHAQQASIKRWIDAEEEGFGRTLDQGSKLLDELVKGAKEAGQTEIAASEAFKLHDTFGFPFDLTKELLEESGLSVDDGEFTRLMDQQRSRARNAAGQRSDTENPRQLAQSFATEVNQPTEFVGYEDVEQVTTATAVINSNGRNLVKLSQSPFYAAGGGQISDSGTIECQDGDCEATVKEVYRLGDDQVVEVEFKRGQLKPGESVVAKVDRQVRNATAANHTATHLLQAALRMQLGEHVKQAGSSVTPQKLRFDFTHTEGLSSQQLKAVEDQVNEWILANYPVKALTTTLDEAKRLGAMALFGEKYGEVVRVVEVGDGSFSRELCGGTHVNATAEIGVFKITNETSSAANVRRIEAVTGPVAVELLRQRDSQVTELSKQLKTTPDQLINTVSKNQSRIAELQKQLKKGGGSKTEVDPADLLKQVEQMADTNLLFAELKIDDDSQLLATLDLLKAKLDPAVIVLAAAVEGKVQLVVSVAPTLVEHGIKAGAVVKVAAAEVGGGGGGRDTLARAGGSKPEQIGQALQAARKTVVELLEA